MDDRREVRTIEKKKRQERSYRDYLINLVDLPDGLNYRFLLEILWEKEFYAVLPRDTDRARDGTELRIEAGFEDEGIFGPSRVLEVLIGMSKRYAFEIYNWRGVQQKNLYLIDVPGTEKNSEDALDETIDDHIVLFAELFWRLIDNLGLSKYDKIHWDNTHILVEIDEIVAAWLDRKLEYNGVGGPFPLAQPERDQKDVELWYQLQAYIMENHVNV